MSESSSGGRRRRTPAARAPRPAPRAAVPTREQVSAGGVAVRTHAGRVEVALVCVGPRRRWQLPKGLVDPGETPELTALREVREEAGIDTELVAPLDTVEYWFYAEEQGERVRFHKRVHFFLLRFRGGSVADHDYEVLEARWVPLADAGKMLAFANERAVVEMAGGLVARD